MKKLFVLCTVFLSLAVFADEKIQFNFPNEEITKIIEIYSKASNTRFVIDSTVRGKISLLNSSPLSLEEAYNQLSEALGLNGFGILKKEDYSIVRNARSIQRDGIEVSTQLPSLRPQRMATWIVNLKYISAYDMQKYLGRFINSSYGEMQILPHNNQLVISDFTSTLHRISQMIKEADIPADPKMAKLNPQNNSTSKKNNKSDTDETKD